MGFAVFAGLIGY